MDVAVGHSHDSECSNLSFHDATDVISQSSVRDGGGHNDYDESWGDYSDDSNGQPVRPLSRPNPVVLLALLMVPYMVLFCHALHVGVDVNHVLQDVAVNAFYMTTFVLCLLGAAKLYYHRQRLLEWTVRLLYYANDGPLPGVPLDNTKRCIGVQTHDTDFNRQADTVRNYHATETRRARRHILQMRKKYSSRVKKLKDLAKERNMILSRLQLKFPEVEHEKETLVAERDAIEKQLEEEKRRNKELIGRFQRINQQFGRLGHAQYPPPLMALDLYK
ncbi:uncharacterized protein [Haliotis cracherodii]|uniref:uncharacterized protein n=1 Tax=Haliotis cracherodii TaxID=6455 RepID=UPI0039E99BA9